MKIMKWLCIIGCIQFVADAEVITISKDDARKIGMQIWQNECNRTVAGLTFWHSNEKFPSLGIGHFIWFPQQSKQVFRESFPRFIEALKEKKISVPRWLIKNDEVIACPWKTKAEFEKEFNSKKMNELRKFLVDTIDLQIRFILDNFKEAFEKMLKHTPKRKQAHVRKQLKLMVHSSNGLYALIDYVNFKGSGVDSSEKHNGYAWGLLQVLSGMRAENPGEKAVEEFVESAKRVLQNRIAQAPKENHEERFLEGWNNRLNTYLKPL